VALADLFSAGFSKSRILRRSLFLLAVATGALAPAAAAAPPQLDIDWSPGKPAPHQTVTFEGQTDKGEVLLWEWDLNGDGEFDERTGKRVTYAYAGPGDIHIAVRATFADGDVRTHTGTVRVREPDPGKPPEASFVFFPAAPVAGEPVTLVSTSTDPDSPISASALRWDLNGDGVFAEATGPSAIATFPAPGDYPVALQVRTNTTDVVAAVVPVRAATVGVTPQSRFFTLMSPFPVVRIAGRVTQKGARIRRLSVDAPPGATVKVRCQGRGCPFKRARHTVSMRARAGALPPSRVTRIRRLEGRVLRSGAILRVSVTRSDAIGKFTRFRIRRGKPPARADMCLVPGSSSPAACPSSR
jgi:hypothetical protein